MSFLESIVDFGDDGIFLCLFSDQNIFKHIFTNFTHNYSFFSFFFG